MLVVDAGVTTGLQTAGSSALKRGKETAAVVAQKLAPRDYVTLIRAGSRPELLYRGYLADNKELLDKIAHNRARHRHDRSGRRPWPKRLNERPHGPRRSTSSAICSGRSWLPLADHPVVRQLGHDVQLVVMNVGSDQNVENVALLGEPPRALRPIVDFPVLLRAKVAASRHAEPVSTHVSVRAGRSGRRPIERDDAARSTGHGGAGDHPQARGHPPRPLRAAARRVSRRQQLRVLPECRAADSGAVNHHSRRWPAGRSCRLSPRGPGQSAVGPGGRKPAGSKHCPIAFDHGHPQRSVQRVASGRGRRDRRRRPGDRRQPRHAVLRKHLERGGGLLVLAGPHVDPGRYTQCLFNATTPRGANTPLVRYEGATGNPDDEATFRPITFVDNQHPALSQFETGEIDYFGTARLYRYLPLTIAATHAWPGCWSRFAGDRPPRPNPPSPCRR